MLEETVSDACEAVGRYVELRPRATLALTALVCVGFLVANYFVMKMLTNIKV